MKKKKKKKKKKKLDEGPEREPRFIEKMMIKEKRIKIYEKRRGL